MNINTLIKHVKFVCFICIEFLYIIENVMYLSFDYVVYDLGLAVKAPMKQKLMITLSKMSFFF